MSLYGYVLLPVLVGLFVYMMRGKWMAPIMVTFQTILIFLMLHTFMEVNASGPIIWNSAGYTDGLALSFYADTLSVVLGLMTVILFLFFIVYSIGQQYFQPQFSFLYLVLQGLILGLFFSSDLFNMFIFLEVSTVVVAILIMINKEKQAIYDGMIYFFVNVIGTSFLLLGIGFLYNTFGLLDWRYLEQAMGGLQDPRGMILPFALMMVTVSLKTAVVPLFSWLPRAHGTPSAPPVVSAALSGVYIKVGVYMFIRFTGMFQPVIDMSQFFFWVGFITSVVGFVMALGQHDIKLILAYHTVSQIGLIMMGITMNSEIAFWGGIFHMFSHALFKSALFLTAGSVYEEYGTRDVYQIRGVLKKMPVVGMAMSLAILGIMGAPLFNASISKYMIAHGTTNYGITLALNLINLGTIMSFIKFGTMLFGSPKKDFTPAKVKGTEKYSSLILGLTSLLAGIFSVPLVQFLFNYELHVNGMEYLQKNLVTLLMIVAGIGFYHGIIKHGGILDRIGHVELTFNGIITSMVGYFIVIVAAVGLVF